MFQEFIATTIFVFAFYAWLFCPRHKAETAPATVETPICYFPEVDEIEEAIDCSKVDYLPEVEYDEIEEQVIDYSKMTIRQLKAECKKLTGTPRAIKKYSRLTRQQIIAALSAS